MYVLLLKFFPLRIAQTSVIKEHLHRVGSLIVKRKVNYVSIPYTLLITRRSSSSKYSVKVSSVKITFTKTGASRQYVNLLFTCKYNLFKGNTK